MTRKSKSETRSRPGLFNRIAKRIKKLWTNEVNVYFISGMCYNCSVFDKIKLPEGYNKQYIEWHIPRHDESLAEYARTMEKSIDTTKPFMLAGYSFGGVIAQEISCFLSPLKVILISTFKSDGEIPMLFKAAKSTNAADRIPARVYASTELITDLFNRFVYHTPTSEQAEVMTFIDPVYVKWAIEQIINWVPRSKCKYLHHIHGTEDQIFPYELIKNAFPVEGGDHLMVLKKADIISIILGGILLMKE
ncbi:alpha/beta hydrolase [Dysgonomonas sp. 521]|uniref:alpha/beta hydrolase family protein n=1 Tax=Dysgonomonas sp. 521 TaxID=2302932 RepID=UPI0013D094E7|nr:alpha/beta hydrolase family protein [Dysgonomonas sp. 521]NDV94835.1 alpha/beta hydrolase [Dysgonomonas sp. 521]